MDTTFLDDKYLGIGPDSPTLYDTTCNYYGRHVNMATLTLHITAR